MCTIFEPIFVYSSAKQDDCPGTYKSVKKQNSFVHTVPSSISLTDLYPQSCLAIQCYQQAFWSRYSFYAYLIHHKYVGCYIVERPARA